MVRASVAVDPRGPRAEELGRTLTGSGAQSYVLLDGYDAGGWRGDARDADVALEEAGRALRCDAGGAGAAGVWSIDGGLALVEYFPDDAIDRPYAPAIREALGLRVAQLPARGKVARVGTIEIASGCLAVLPVYGDGSPITRRAVDAAARRTQVTNLGEGDLGLVPLAPGRYDVFRERLRTSEDGLGELDARIRVVRSSVPPARRASAGEPTRPPARPRQDVLVMRAAEAPGCWTLIDWKDAPAYDEDDFIQAAVALGKKRLGFEMQGRRRRMVICSVGESRHTALWPIEGGVALVELVPARGVDLGSAAARGALGEAIARPPASKATALGTLSVRSGGIAAFHSEHHGLGRLAPVARARALRRGSVPIGFMVPLASGRYAVTSDLVNAKTRFGTALRRVRVVKT